MPIDKPANSAAPSSRRSLFSALLPAGRGQAAPASSEAVYAAQTAPLELAATLVYQAAIGTGFLDADWEGHARSYQSHHQEVTDTLTALLPADAADLEALIGSAAVTPDESLLGESAAAIGAAGDQNGVLIALVTLEDQLAATHLDAIGRIENAVTAKVAAQILAVESQNSLTMGRAAGLDLAEITPATMTTDGARQPSGN